MGTEIWTWVWFLLAGAFLVGEMFTGGFFLLPFGIGAAAAGTLALLDAPLVWQWIVFIVVSAVALFSLRRFSDRVTHEPPEKVGIDRLLGQHATVIDVIEGARSGRVRVNREEWRAVASDGGSIPVGTSVVVDSVVGTQVVVHAIPDHTDDEEQL